MRQKRQGASELDRNKISKLITSKPIEGITIPSTAVKSEKDRLLREFFRKAEKTADGEITLILIKT
jgi:hypothetical protein